MYKRKIILFLGSFYICMSLSQPMKNSFSFSSLSSLNLDNIIVLKTVETRNSYISYVVIDGTPLIMKQKKNLRKQISTVRDSLAAWLIKDLEIAHLVDIIPYNIQCPGKIIVAMPATLHTIAPGFAVRRLYRGCVYKKLRLKQWWGHEKSIEDQGLTWQIIEFMTWHRQIPIIIGFDLVIGNSDRHEDNYFFDEETDSFCAIDMDDTFNKDLCDLAYKKLEKMVMDPACIFTQKEINALRHLKETINYVITVYSSERVIKKMRYFARKAGFSKGKPLYNFSIKKKLNYYTLMINRSWKSAHRLVVLLDKIINNNYKKRI